MAEIVHDGHRRMSAARGFWRQNVESEDLLESRSELSVGDQETDG